MSDGEEVAVKANRLSTRSFCNRPGVPELRVFRDRVKGGGACAGFEFFVLSSRLLLLRLFHHACKVRLVEARCGTARVIAHPYEGTESLRNWWRLIRLEPLDL